MTKLLLRYHKKTNTYYVEGKNIKCSKCNKEVYGLSRYILGYNNKKITQFVLHIACDVELLNYNIIQKRLIIINDVIPEDTTPIIDLKPQLKDGSISIYDIDAIDKRFKDSINETINKTMITQESFEGCSIGVEVVNDKIFDIKNIKKYLLEHKK